MHHRAAKIVLGIVGAIFVAHVYPLVMSFLQPQQWKAIDPALQVLLTIYFTLGIFMLAAVPHPQAHRSLILFAAWSSFAHGAVMTAQAFRIREERLHMLVGAAVLAIAWLALLAVMPARSDAAPGAEAASR
jgi:hypothetical protein